MSDADPHCPECGEPIGQTATYCMHCSADLTAEQDAADADDDGTWDGAESSGGTDAGSVGETKTWGTSSEESGGERTAGSTDDESGGSVTGGSASSADEQLLDPDGLVDNTLTVVVGIVGGIVVGIIGLIVTPIVTGSGWGILVGIIAWLGSTAYLVRQRTVQGAVAKSGYAIAVVLLLIPLIALSPLMDVEGGLAERGKFFATSLIVVAFPAGFAAIVGYVASRFVPEDAGETPA